MTDQSQACCPEFHPEKWDQKSHDWYGKPFIKDSLPTFFHIPFPPMIGQKMTKLWKMVEDAQKAEPDKTDTLLLFRDPSPFKSEMYVSVTGPVPEAENVNLSGSFISKVFAGAYNDIPKFIKEMDGYLAGQDKKAKDYYVHYAYCPKCAKKFGNNYMILFAQV
jgi:hypothetical protein